MSGTPDVEGGGEDAHERDLMAWLGHQFARLGAYDFDHRSTIVGVSVALIAVTVAVASTARFDNSLDAFFPVSDDAYAVYLDYQDEFGSDEVSYIVYEAPGSEYGPFDVDVMARIAELTERLEDEVPFVSEVTSLANVESIEGVEGGLDIRPLLERAPGGQADLLALRDRVLRDPLYVGGIVSADGLHGAIIIEMTAAATDPLEELRFDPEGGDDLPNLYPQVTYDAIERILAEPAYAGIEFHHVGDVPLNAIYNTVAMEDSELLGTLTFVLVAVALLLSFLRISGLIGPLAVVLMSLASAVASVVLFGWNLDFMFIMLPTLLIAVGVADAVHILTEFHAALAETDDRRIAASRTLGLVGAPCLLTSLTTAAGFASMTVSPIKAIAHFAAYSAVGVMVAFVLSVTLLVACLSMGRRHPRGRTAAEPAPPESITNARGGALVLGMLEGVGRISIRFRTPILAGSFALIAISLYGATKLRVDSNIMNEFSDDAKLRKETLYVDDVMGGSLSLVYLLDSGEREGMKSPQALADLDRLETAANHESQMVRKTFSLAGLMKDLNQTFHEEDPAEYRLPETRALAAQYLLLYEMSGGDELSDYVSGDLARASLDVRVRNTDVSQLAKLIDDLDAALAEKPLDATEVTVTGVGALWLVMMDYITSSQIRGFSIAFVVVAILLCITFRSVGTGLIAMIPNLAPIVLTLGLMGYLGIALDYVKLLIASVAIGISVDDTIHHVTRFRIEFQRLGRYDEALLESMRDVGRPLFITSAVLVAGFLIYLAAEMDSMKLFGTLLATTIGLALVADFFMMPALVMLIRPWGPEHDLEAGDRAR